MPDKHLNSTLCVMPTVHLLSNDTEVNLYLFSTYYNNQMHLMTPREFITIRVKSIPCIAAANTVLAVEMGERT